MAQNLKSVSPEHLEPHAKTINSNEHDGQYRNHDDGQKEEAAELFRLSKGSFGFRHDYEIREAARLKPGFFEMLWE
jgi:hypothetical protein